MVIILCVCVCICMYIKSYTHIYDLPHSLLCLKSGFRAEFGVGLYEGLQQERMVLRDAYPNA